MCTFECVCVHVSTQPTSKATCRLHFLYFHCARLKARLTGNGHSGRRVRESEADKQLSDGLIAVWSHWSQARRGYYLTYSKQTITPLRQPTLAHNVSSNAPTASPCCFMPNSLILQTRPHLLIEFVVALTGRLWTATTVSVHDSDCVFHWKYFGRPVYFCPRRDARREKGPSVCLTFKMLSPHHSSKSYKAFGRVSRSKNRWVRLLKWIQNDSENMEILFFNKIILQVWCYRFWKSYTWKLHCSTLFSSFLPFIRPVSCWC